MYSEINIYLSIFSHNFYISCWNNKLQSWNAHFGAISIPVPTHHRGYGIHLDCAAWRLEWQLAAFFLWFLLSLSNFTRFGNTNQTGLFRVTFFWETSEIVRLGNLCATRTPSGGRAVVLTVCMIAHFVKCRRNGRSTATKWRTKIMETGFSRQRNMANWSFWGKFFLDVYQNFFQFADFDNDFLGTTESVLRILATINQRRVLGNTHFPQPIISTNSNFSNDLNRMELSNLVILPWKDRKVRVRLNWIRRVIPSLIRWIEIRRSWSNTYKTIERICFR